MDVEQSKYLADYEDNLLRTLLRQVTDAGFLRGELLAVEELEERWTTSAPEYMAAAVPQIKDYPLVSIAWAGYFGIGASVLWDSDWESYADIEDLYTVLASPRGFDCMDEYVTEGLLGYELEGKEAVALENMLRSVAQTADTMIRKENIEAQSVMAFYVFARTTKVLFRLGVAIGLRILGYNYVKAGITES